MGTHGELDGDADERLQQLLRETNERLRRLGEHGAEPLTLQLLCECGRCSERIEVPLAVFQEARRSPAQLLVRGGHENGSLPVWSVDGVSVVQRRSDAA